MLVLEATEIAAWALIIGAIAYGALASRGTSVAAVAAGLAAVATKTALLGLT
jgi:hypothetical protein